MTDESAECPYCGETFHSDEDGDAITKEGIHRAQEHVNNNGGNETRKSKGQNIVNEWKGTRRA
ncbi:MAG: hypothetical protein ABEK01_00310 [Candidatus Nanohaloarchaea archaeon]